MVASSRTSSSASSVASISMPKSKQKSPARPHYLGGSNNLLHERQRREKAEHSLDKTKSKLNLLKQELAPKVEQLIVSIKSLELDKQKRQELDEASQEILECLQEQVDKLTEYGDNLPDALDQRFDEFRREMHQKVQEDKFEMKQLFGQVQSIQEDLAAEIRLVQSQLTASQNFSSQRLNALDDAIERLRKDFDTKQDNSIQNMNNLSMRIGELDEKLFNLDKELLRIKLILPASAFADKHHPLTGAVVGGISGSGSCSSSNRQDHSSILEINKKLQEISLDIEALKADMIAYRNGDRRQFDAITNRVRESSKAHQLLRKDMDERFQEIKETYEHMVTKVPHEFSKRLLNAQHMWDEEIQGIKAFVQRIELEKQEEKALRHGSNPRNQDWMSRSMEEVERLTQELKTHQFFAETLQNDLANVQSEMQVLTGSNETTTKALQVSINKLQEDLVGLYDWSNNKIDGIQEEVTFNSQMLNYFKQHAKILPK